MEIKAVKFRKEGFYSQPFAFGGEEGMDKFDLKVRYRGSLQNYLIDTGDEVILVDTGLPAGTPEESPDETSLAFTGKDISSYMDALTNLGYNPEQVPNRKAVDIIEDSGLDYTVLRPGYLREGKETDYVLTKKGEMARGYITTIPSLLSIILKIIDDESLYVGQSISITRDMIVCEKCHSYTDDYNKEK